MSHILPLAFGIGFAGLLVVGITAAIVKGTLRIPSIFPKSSATAPYEPYAGSGGGAGTGGGEGVGSGGGKGAGAGAWRTPYDPSGPGAGIVGSELEAPASSPLAPSNLAITNSASAVDEKGSSVRGLTWTPPLAGQPAGYTVLRDGKPVDSVPGNRTTYPLPGLPTDGKCTKLQLVPFDDKGVAGPPSHTLSAALSSDPNGITLTAQPMGPGPNPNGHLAWNTPATGTAGGIGGYAIFRDGQQIGTVKPPNSTRSDVNTFVVRNPGLIPGQETLFSVAPISPSGEVIGAPSSKAPISWYPVGSSAGPNASQPMMAPTGLQLTSDSGFGLFGSSRSGKLSWNSPASGSPGNYAIFSDGQVVGNVSGSATSADVPRGGKVYQVLPIDRFGNVGPASLPVSGDPGMGVPAPYRPLIGPGAGIAGSGVDAPAPSPLAPSSLAVSSFNANGSGPGSATLSWRPPQNGTPHSYSILKNGTPAGSVPGSQTSIAVSDLPTNGSPSTLQVVPFDERGYAGPPSSPLAAILPRDPATGIALTSTPIGNPSNPSALISWTTPAGDLQPGAGGPPGYAVFQDGRQIGVVKPSSSGINSFTAKNLPSSTVAESLFSVAPVSPSGGTNGPTSSSVPLLSYPVNSGAGPAPPTAMMPSNVRLTSVPGLFGSSGSGSLSWSPPAAGYPASYAVTEDGRVAGTVPANQKTFEVSAAAKPGAVYQVLPIDRLGSVGPPSQPAHAVSGVDPSVAGAPATPYGPSSTSRLAPGAGIAGSGITAKAPDTLAPSNLALSKFNGSGTGSATLSWSPPTMGLPASYTILKGGDPIAVVPGNQTSVPVSGLPTTGGATTLQVVPFDSNGVAGPASSPLAVSLPSDPVNGIALTSTVSGPETTPGALLSWTTPSAALGSDRDRAAGGLAGYAILKDGVRVATAKPSLTGVNAFTIKSLPPSATESFFSVIPLSQNGTPFGQASNSVPLASYPAGSGAGPASPADMAPSNLQLASSPGLFGSSGRLSWSPPRAGHPASYAVIGDGKVLGTVPASQTSFDVSPKGGEPGSVYQVAPLDRYGNVGPGTSPVSSFGPAPGPYSSTGFRTPVDPSSTYGPSSGPGAGIAGSGVDAPAPSPLAPSSLALSTFNGSGPGSATLSWKCPALGSPASYTVLKDGKPVASVPGNQTSVPVPGLPTTGGATTLQVVPFDSNGVAGPASSPLAASLPSDPSSGIALTATPAGSAASASPSALLAGPGSATLSWKRPASGSPASYTVLKDGKPVASVPGNQTSVPVSGLPTNGGASALQVVPFDSNGVAGPASSPLAVSLPSDPSSGIALTSTPAGSGASPSALLAWTTPATLGSVPSFGVLQDGRQVATAKASPSGVNTFVPKGLSASAAANSYFSVVPLSSSGSPAGPASNSVPLASYPAGSGAGPASPADMAPSNLQLTSSPGLFGLSMSGRLSWSPPRAGRPASYAVIGDGKVLGTVPASQTWFETPNSTFAPSSAYQVLPIASNGSAGPPSSPVFGNAFLPESRGASGPSVLSDHAGPGAGIAGSGVDAPAPSPLAPSSLALSTFNGSGPGSATLSWKRPALGSPTSYTVLKDGKPVASVPGNQTSVPVSGLPTNGGASALQVVPFDSNGVAGPASSPLAVSLPSDRDPSSGSGIALTSTPAGSGASPSALLAWTTPTSALSADVGALAR
eukprot:tig00000459_g1071.t1